jgi:hypothetical protein
MRAAIVGLLGALTLVACRAPVREAETPAPESSAASRARELSKLLAFGRSFGETRAALRERLGEPRTLRADTATNRHGVGTDTLFALEFRGLAFSVRKAGAPPRELLEVASLDSRSRSLPAGPAGIVIARTRESELRARLGAPAESRQRGDTLQLIYRASAPGDVDEYVQFELVRAVLRRVVWIFYVD